MNIASVKTFVVGTPPPHFGGRYWIFLKLTTDGGVEGIGEVYSVPFHPQVVTRMIEDVCERCVIGADPFKLEKLWRIIYSSGFTQRPDTSLLGILSGIEIACWDIVGKELNKPVYELLGGRVHDRLRSYTYIYPQESDKSDVYTDADLAAQRAAEYVEQGFTAVKFDPVGPYTAFDPRQLSLQALEHSHPWPDDAIERDSPGQAAGKIRSAVVRRAGAAGETGGNGTGGAGNQHSYRHRRAARDQVRVF
jgi:2-dehydro-3-deoxyphosphogalactonate aldolase